MIYLRPSGEPCSPFGVGRGGAGGVDRLLRRCGGIGIAAGAPVAAFFKQAVGIFPIFEISNHTMWMQAACAAVVAVAAAIVPAVQAARVRIVEGLRSIA